MPRCRFSVSNLSVLIIWVTKQGKSWDRRKFSPVHQTTNQNFNPFGRKPPSDVSSMLKSSWSKSAMALNTMDLEASWSLSSPRKDPVELFGKLTKGKFWKKKQQIKKKQICNKLLDNTLLFLGRNPQLLGVPKQNYCCVDPPIHWPKMSYISSNGRGWDYQQKKNASNFWSKKA